MNQEYLLGDLIKGTKWPFDSGDPEPYAINGCVRNKDKVDQEIAEGGEGVLGVGS